MNNNYRIVGNKAYIQCKESGTPNYVEAVIDVKDLGRVLDVNETFYYRSPSKGSPHIKYAYTPKGVYLHRIVMDAPKGITVDHINHNTLNNTRENLRMLTHAQNLQNTKMYKSNTSGYKGVDEVYGGFRARLCINGERKFLGIFPTPQKAHQIYCEAKIQYHAYATEYSLNGVSI